MTRFAIKLVLTIVVLVAVVRSIDGERVLQVLSTADLWLVLLAASCTVVLNALRPLRWLWLLHAEAPELRYRDALKSHLFATGARLIVPGQIGEFGKALAVDVNLAKATGLAGVDVALDVSTTLIVAALGGALIFGPGPVFAALAATGLLLFSVFVVGRWLFKRRWFRLHQGLTSAWQAFWSVPRNVLVKGFVLSMGLQGLRLVQLVILIRSLGVVPSPIAVASLPAVQVADAFSFTFGRIGVREWMGGALLPSFGLHADIGVTAIFLQTLISNILPGLVGLAVIYGTRRTAMARLGLTGAS